ncbi:MAG: CHASE2 domain-containing protein [Limnochordia bacterium]|jgi:adenylate cyclase
MSRFVGWTVRGVAVGVLVGILSFAGLFEGCERRTLDARTAFCGRFFPDRGELPIAVVAIDEQALAQSGRWPWRRATLASLVQRVFAEGAAVVAVDLLFSEPSTGDTQLAEALSLGPSVLAVYGEGDRQARPVPPLAAVAQAGHVEMYVDADAVARSVPLERGGTLPFGVVAARRWSGKSGYLGPPGQPLWLDVRLREASRRLHLAALTPTVSAADVMDGSVPEGLLAGKLVFIGLAAAGTVGLDAHITPLRYMGPIPGVYVQAALARAELANRHPLRSGVLLSALVIVIVGLTTGAALGLGGAEPTGLRVYGWLAQVLPVVTAYGAVTLLLWGRWALWLPWIGPVLTSSALTGWAGLERGLLHEQERRHLRRLFARYLSPAALPELLARKDELGLAGVERQVAVVFADIRGFTALAEQLTPVELMELVNLYLETLARTVREHGGMVDKYLGDGLMAVFGAPLALAHPAEAAVECAVCMHAAVAQLQPPPGLPAFSGIGVGVHFGEAVLGTIGGAERLEYTALGDVVNVASRLEELADLGSVVFTEAVTDGLSEDSWLRKATREVGCVDVRGKSAPLKVYRLAVGPAGNGTGEPRAT